MANIGGLNFSATQRGGGSHFVFVRNAGMPSTCKPQAGIVIKNPFTQGGKIYQGNLGEYTIDGEGYILKTYEIVANITAGATVLNIPNYGISGIPRSHKPEVGTVIMKAPTLITGTGASASITKVENEIVGGKSTYKVTLSNAIGVVTTTDVLVEATSLGATVTPLVQNPNCFFDTDMDFTAPTNAVGMTWSATPSLHETAYIQRMGVLPAYVFLRNKSLVTGLFEL